MAARKDKLSEPSPAESAAATVDPNPSAGGKLSSPRFSFALTADEAGIDFGSMRESNKERLRKILQQGDTLKQLGLQSEPTATPEASAALDAMLADKAVELVGLLAVMGAKRAGYQDKHAQLVSFKRPQKEALAPLAARILGKYNLLGGKYAEELAALALAGAYVADNWQMMREMAEKEGAAPPADSATPAA